MKIEVYYSPGTTRVAMPEEGDHGVIIAAGGPVEQSTVSDINALIP